MPLRSARMAGHKQGCDVTDLGSDVMHMAFVAVCLARSV